MSNKIVSMVNGASFSLVSEKKELAKIDKQIHNGVRALLQGAHFPELEEEVDRLRIRKSELEDIIARNEGGGKVDKNELIKYMIESKENIDTDIKSVVKAFITKIYAQTDGSFTVNLGVHLNGCGGRI